MTKPYDIAETELGKAGLGWVLSDLVGIVRGTREHCGVNDVLIYYWVFAPNMVQGVGRAREPALANLKEAYPKAMEAWEALSTPPSHPDHVTVIVFDEESKGLFTMRLTIEGCRNTGMVN